MTEITVIITTYNLERYIDESLNDLLAQTFQNFNIIIVDDFSTDNTRDKIANWRNKFPEKIQVIYLDENLGMPSLVRNVALNSGKLNSRYIVFLDGDDKIENDYLEKLYNAIKTENADIAICAYDRVEENTNVVLCDEMLGFPHSIHIPPTNDILAFINTALWNKIWKTELFNGKQFPPFKVGEEVGLQFEIFCQCKKIVFIEEKLIHYRVRKNSVISNTPNDAIRMFADELNGCYENQESIMKNTLEFIIFIHIGISMAIRAMDNPEINLKLHLKWTKEYFKDNYNWFKGNDFFKLSNLFKNHGLKGIVLKIIYILYRVNCFGVILYVYRFLKQKFHIDIKF